jgi:hypothetical protein
MVLVGAAEGVTRVTYTAAEVGDDVAPAGAVVLVTPAEDNSSGGATPPAAARIATRHIRQTYRESIVLIFQNSVLFLIKDFKAFWKFFRIG